jgi:DNA-binding LacI/PurR family transcriptional regulator
VKPQRVTLRQIAKAARVHVMTVSRALRRDPSIPDKTRRRIARIAAKMGYIANPLVSAWMIHVRSGRTPGYRANIALLVPKRHDDEWHYGYRKLREGATAHAARFGYGLENISLEEVGGAAQRLNAVFRARGICGVLVPPFFAGVRLPLEWDRLIAVAIGDRDGTPALHLARNDHGGTLALAIHSLRQLGYSRVGFHVEKIIDEAIAHRWSAGWLLHQHHIPRRDRIPLLCSERGDAHGFAQWFKRWRPEAVLSKDVEVMAWLKRLGLRVPGDVGFAHLDWIPEFGDCAGVDQHIELTAANAVDLVIEQIQQHRPGVPVHAKIVLAESDWVGGRTV